MKEEVDALISQWQNVDVEELMNTNVEMSPRNIANDNLPSHDDTDKAEAPAENSEPAEDTAVTNGSWNTNSEELSWRTEETAEQKFSAKEQRIRTKSSGKNSVPSMRHVFHTLFSSSNYSACFQTLLNLNCETEIHKVSVILALLNGATPSKVFLII